MIERENHEWGVRLICKPFEPVDVEVSPMQISADINNPTPGRSAYIRFWFSAVPIQTPLKATEVMIWVEALKAVAEEAKKVGEELKAKPSKSDKPIKVDKKTAKKAVKKKK